MSEPSADDLTKRLFVCCGYVTLESGKPGIAIAEAMAEPVEPSDETASQFHILGTGLRIYERKLLRHFSVGTQPAASAPRPCTAFRLGQTEPSACFRSKLLSRTITRMGERGSASKSPG